MRKVFEEELLELHNEILRMGGIVEEQIYNSIEALVRQDESIAQDVIKNDDIIDEFDKNIENTCIRLIAKQSPLAADLRTVFIASKIATDLERMGDHAVDIAKITKKLKNEVYVKKIIDIPRMADLVKSMIKRSLDAYVENDIKKAYEVCKADDDIDDLYKQVFGEFFVFMTKDPKQINQITQFLFVCKYLERIADHVTNICESTIYVITGEQVDLNE